MRSSGSAPRFPSSKTRFSPSAMFKHSFVEVSPGCARARARSQADALIYSVLAAPSERGALEGSPAQSRSAARRVSAGSLAVELSQHVQQLLPDPEERTTQADRTLASGFLYGVGFLPTF